MLLYGLLNKATRNFSSSETEKIINSYVLNAKQDYGFFDYLANNPLLMSAIILAIMGILVGFIMVQNRNAEKLTASNNALNASRAALEDALAAANEANAAKTTFLSQMSHDIRTPLNGIIGMTKIAGDNLNDRERLKDALGKVSRSSDHLLTLINDILDLSRIESGKMTMTHEPADIRAMVSQCVDILKSSASNRDLEIVTEIAPVEKPFVLTDALHVRQILINIISNAVKFTPDGGKILFSTKCSPDADGNKLLCRFEVTDTGIGMSEDFLDHIYEAFTQADSYNARTRFLGTGLGMSIVRQFVDMLGGTINIKSKLGAGTSVIVELPFDIDMDADAKAAEGPAGKRRNSA
jgi:signal transduction histidine kinase